MRTRRLKAHPDAPSGLYHCISRIVDRRLVFGDVEKEHFCRLMRGYATFCGVRILTFCILGNHFHLLVEVPRRPSLPPDDRELLRRIAAIHSTAQFHAIRDRLARASRPEQEAIRLRFWRRMGDISQFLKELKQRFSQWHNLRQGRHGTLWEERFKSVLIGTDGAALSTIAAYIDLNPVRAGIVANPACYRWSGYGQAMAGLSIALEGYRALLAIQDLSPLPPHQAFAQYRHRLFDYAERRGLFLQSSTRKTRPRPTGQSQAALPTKPANNAPANPSSPSATAASADPPGIVERLLHRIGYFTNGAVIGTRGFIESFALQLPPHPSRAHPRPAHPIGTLASASLFSLKASRS